MFHTGSINHFILNRQGGVAIIFSLLLIPMMCIASMALDYSRALHLKSRITQATDAALLSAANVVMEKIRLSKIDETSRKKVDDMLAEQFESFFEANMKGTIQHERRDAIIDYDLKTQKVTVNVKANYPVLMFERIASLLPSRKDAPVVEDWGLSVTAATYMKTKEKNSASIFFVFDASTSMSHDAPSNNSTKEILSRIDALKKAVNQLILYFKDVDPKERYIRTGGLTYEYEVKNETPLKWRRRFIKKLLIEMEAKGGTDIYEAMKQAKKKISTRIEKNKHAVRNKIEPNLSIVLMTDGENGHPSKSNLGNRISGVCRELQEKKIKAEKENKQLSEEEKRRLSECLKDISDDLTLEVCRGIKRNGIKIYTVAFGTTSRGKRLLLNCSSGKSYHYNAHSSEELTLAYKDIGERVLGKERLSLHE